MIGLNSASARSRCINIATKKRTDRGDYIEKVCSGNSGTGFFYILSGAVANQRTSSLLTLLPRRTM